MLAKLVLVLLLTQASPVSPERIDPEQLPIPQANAPVEQGWVPPQAQPARPGTTIPKPRIEAPSNAGGRMAPSLMGDEDYRRARVRALLESALRQHGRMR